MLLQIRATDIKRPKQAVILAGGRGTRLRPLTDTVPKPMIRFHGKPFLEYILEQLKEQGFERVLLLLGYLPYTVQDYFKNGKGFGLDIDYSITDIENETGRRIKFAADKLDACFLLMYCDNYWPMRMDLMWDHFSSTKALAQITVYSNKDSYTKNNLLTDAQGMVKCYDKSRMLKGLQGVDIGYAIIRKEVLELIPDKNVNFENVVYPLLVEKRQLSAYMTDHRYYSAGSHDRLHLTDSFLKPKKAVILDRDGVLNKKPPKGEYVRTWHEFEWLSGAKKAISLLKSAGYIVIIVTNQAGIARGMMTESDLHEIHQTIQKETGKAIDAFYYCPHGWDEGCDCRKPKPGMLFQAQKDFHLDLTRTIFIGDDERDEMAGHAAGCPTILVNDNYPLLSAVKEKIINDKLLILQ